MRQHTHRQKGFVSLFSVIFFMLFVTVITVGFLRIMTTEQRQALDNDLTASALAAAQSGVEDAKRAILKYYDMDPSDPLYAPLGAALTSPACNSLTQSSAVRSALGLDASGSGNIVGNSQINQAYTCLSVNLNSPNYIAQSSAGVSDFIPLRTNNAGGFQEIDVAWHLISTSVGNEGDGVPTNHATTTSLPTVSAWNAARTPAYLRVQLYGYPNGSFNRDSLNNLSHSYLLVPSRSTTAGSVSATTALNFGSDDPRGFDQNKNIVRGVQCLPSPMGDDIGSYACSARLALPAGSPSTSNTYYLRVTPIYGQSHFKVTLRSNGADVEMNGVQPVVDVTGKAEDVFRRLQTRVKVNPAGGMPEFAVESADTICKNMKVADTTYYQANSCP